MICRDHLAEYDAREPVDGDLCCYCWSRGRDVELVEDECPVCAERDGVILAFVGSVATILLWLFLSAPASSAEAISARGSGEAGAFFNASPA